MRAIWTGSLSFGLINIPVRLYSASKERPLSFKLLEKDTLCPISYARVCKATGKEVKYDDIVKGYEYEKGDFVILLDDDFKKANARMTKTIDIVEFTDETEIDPKYYAKPYFIEPEKRSQKAYVLLRDSLRRSKKVAIAKMVLRNREHIAVIKPDGDALMVNQLRFQDELRDASELALPGKETYSKKEIDMALSLINQLTEHFNAADFKDEYADQLKRIIDQKKKGKKPTALGQEPEFTKMTDLMSALKRSLEREKVKAR